MFFCAFAFKGDCPAGHSPPYTSSMPELPEVETVRRGLVPWLEGERLHAVTARRPDLRFPLPPRFAERLTGRTVARLDRRAKYLLIHLDNGQVWLSHLGMSGKYRVLARQDAGDANTGTAGTPSPLGGEGWGEGCRTKVTNAKSEKNKRFAKQPPPLSSHKHTPRPSPLPQGEREQTAPGPTVTATATCTLGKHDHILLTTARATIAYHDPRRFGFMNLIAPEHLNTHPLLAALGPEPLGNAFHAEHLFDVARRSRAPLKALLLDQKVVAGLGNIYVAESLFRARLHPERPGHSLSRDDAERLTRAIREVLQDAVAAGGSSLRDYQGPAGEFGCFQHAFAVYDRAGEPCGICAQPIQRIVQSGRATCYCGICQR